MEPSCGHETLRDRRPGILASLLVVVALAPAAPRAVELPEAARTQLVRIIESRGFTRGLPRRAMPTPDGDRVFFLRSGPADRIQQLYVFDVGSGETRRFLTAADLTRTLTVSAEEQARRERQRETESGLTRFEVSRDGAWLLVPAAGDLFRVDARRGTVQRLTDTPQPEIDAHLSPDGSWVAFVRDRHLTVQRIADGAEARVDNPLPTGVAEFVAQEEMDRSTGHWWSPDGRRLALTEVDERHVPTFRVPDFSDPTGEGHVGPYPKAGDPNARVRIGVLDVEALDAALPGDDPAVLEVPARFFDLPGDDTEYLARVTWSPDGRSLWLQTQPRSQKRLDLWRLDVDTGAATRVLSETDRDWVNLHDDFRLFDDGKRFLWSTERTGHRHLEVFAADGTRERVLTSGAWDVMAVRHLDPESRTVVFVGTREDVRERHLYRVALAGGDVERLSVASGWHQATFHRRGHEVYVHAFSDPTHPPQLHVRNLQGEDLGTLPSAAWQPTAAEREPPTFHRARTASGVELDIQIVHAGPRATATASVPLVVYVYGGPHGQQVRRAWGGERGQIDAWMASQGFYVARIDGRGVWGRGHASERIYAGTLGDEELEDTVAGVRWLLHEYPEIDPSRVGVWGWSYGGYLTLRALEHAADVFAAGVSVAPVVDWHGYDTHYTERYLGLPSANAAGYTASSTLPGAAGIRGQLTLIHGASDDNVHLRESMLLINRLVEAGSSFDLMIYPGTHMMQSLAERSHLYTLVWRTFAEALRPPR